MLKAIKRVVFATLMILMLIMNTVPAFAAGTVAVLSAEDVVLTDKTVLVPVMISNNPGIMGFKISASYPAELIDISGVSAGSVTAKGNFIHNAGKTDGQVDVIWYATEQTAENGSLFVLTVAPTDRFVEGESTQIALTFSQADTFNENYEDVALNCQSINVSYGTPSQQPTDSDAPSQKMPSEITVTDKQIINAVDAALDNTESGGAEDIDSDTLQAINDNLRTILGADAPQFSSAEALNERYHTALTNVYAEQVQTNMEPAVISEMLSGILTERNATSFSALDDSSKGAAVAEAYQRMHDADNTLPDLSGRLSDDASASMFDRLLSEASEEARPTGTQPDTETNTSFPVCIIVIIAIIAFALVCGIVVFLIRRKPS